MYNSNIKFFYKNILKAADLRIPVEVMFSEVAAKAFECWKPILRMEGLASAIALINIVATTLEFSCVERTSDGVCRIPLNLFNVIVARSCLYTFILFFLNEILVLYI